MRHDKKILYFVNIFRARKVNGRLTVENLRDMVLASKPVFRAVFLSMFQGALDMEMFKYWNLNGLQSLEKQMRESPDCIRIDLPGRKLNRNARAQYSHRQGRELMELLHPDELSEIIDVLTSLEPYLHGEIKMQTPKNVIAQAFGSREWELEKEIPLGTKKSDYCDIVKNRVYIEQEFSKFETLFRDFLRFLLLFDSGELDVAVLICYDQIAFSR